jgi:hypothetical protein
MQGKVTTCPFPILGGFLHTGASRELKTVSSEETLGHVERIEVLPDEAYPSSRAPAR